MANNVSPFPKAVKGNTASSNAVDGNGGGGDDGGMEARVTKLEALAEKTSEKLTGIDARLNKIEAALPGLATKEEVHKGFADMIKWIVGSAFALGATGITVMTFVLNNASPKAPPQAPAAQQPPIIINVPGVAPVAAPAASKP